jgi:glycosyltransferase involved in cell wall biosynthesis
MSHFNPLDHEILFDRPERITEDDRSIHAHLPFLFALVDILRPNIIVECGTFGGDSFFAFCQAVARLRLPTRCYAIRSCITTPNAVQEKTAGLDETLQAHLDIRYGAFATQIGTADRNVMDSFPVAAVDLLHITFRLASQAREVFGVWHEKLSPRAVVLLHGIAVGGLGDPSPEARCFWREVSARYDHLEFPHSCGLGLLLVGTESPQELRALCVQEDAPRLRRFFAKLGTDVREAGAAAKNRLQPEPPPTVPGAAREAQAGMPHHAADDSAATIREYAEAKIAASAARHHAASLQDQLALTQSMLRRTELVRRRAAAAALAMVKRLSEQAAAERRAAEVALGSLARTVATMESDHRNRLYVARCREEDLRAQVNALDEQLAEERQRQRSLQDALRAERARAMDLEARLNVFSRSLSWRVTQPLRALRWAQLRTVAPQHTSGKGLSLQPGPDVIPGDGPHEWMCATHDPWFLLDGPVPGGWVRLQYEFKGDSAARPACYADDGDGTLSEYKRIALPGPKDGRVDALLHLPKDVSRLRLDPVDAPGRFMLRNVSVQSLTKLEVTGELVRRFLRKGPWWKQAGALAALTVRGRWDGVRRRLLDALDSERTPSISSYEEWVLRYDRLSDADRRAIRAQIERLPLRPRFSVLMPTYNSDPRWLRAAIESVRRQLYPDWELCIADDASDAREVRAVLDAYAAEDDRIAVRYRNTRGHIAAASNTALSMATGDFVVLLDHDDELAEHALYMVAVAINEHPDAGLIYSDEDKIDESGVRHDPYFKCAWNLDLMRAQNMISHLGAYRRSLLADLGGFRSGVDGSQDYDLALRISERLNKNQIVHIPHVLYHWRAISGSTADTGAAAKPYVIEAARRAIADHLARTGTQAVVLPAEVPAFQRIVYALPNDLPRVTAIIPTRNAADLLKRCVETLRLARYPSLEVLIVDNDSDESDAKAYLKAVSDEGVALVVNYHGPFNYSAINNYAVSRCSGDILVFLNNDVEAMDREWLDELVGNVNRKEVGVAGAALYYRDRTLQHGGVVLGIGGVAGHAHKHLPWGAPGYHARGILAQEFAAVTAACMAMRRKVFEQVGGFDEVNLPVAFNDVDLCLRVREAGYAVVWTPYARLYHFESATRGDDLAPERAQRFLGEQQYMRRRWGEWLAQDPYYNPNLTLDHVDFGLAWPPRAVKPWECASLGSVTPLVARTSDWVKGARDTRVRVAEATGQGAGDHRPLSGWDAGVGSASR